MSLKKRLKKVLKTKPYPFQRRGMLFFKQTKGRALLGDDMGLGKTIQALGWLAVNPSKRPVIIVCPASSKYNWADQIEQHTHMRYQILNSRNPEPVTEPIVIINYDILAYWKEKLLGIQPKVLITDECFPTGTPIKTPSGYIPIEKIKLGDSVLNAFGIGIVKKTNKRISNLIELHLSNGTKIQTTPNHPFFTSEGWIKAKNLYQKILLTSTDVLNIMNEDTILREKKKNDQMPMVPKEIQSKKKNTKILRLLLLSEMENESTTYQKKDLQKSNPRSPFCSCNKDAQRQSTYRQSFFKKNERKQSIFQTRSEKKDQSTLEKIWSSFIKNTSKRRQWKRIFTATKNFMGGIRLSMENRACNPNKTKKKIWLSYMLQSRYSSFRKKDLDRSRRLVTQTATYNCKRQKEKKSIDEIRVERIEIYKPRNNGKPSQHTVYNLQVSGHPSYYVNDFLVHNCHYVKNLRAKRTRVCKELAKKSRHIIAMSGTPIINRPVEFFPILNMICPKEFSSFWKFAFRYCDPKRGWAGKGWDFSGASHLDELRERIEPLFLRRMKKEVLKQLPEKQRTIMSVDIDNQAEYHKATVSFLQWYKNKAGTVAAKRAKKAQALVKLGQLKQLTAKGKLSQACEWIDNFLFSTDEKLVIFVYHQEIFQTLITQYKRIAAIGGKSGKKRQNEVNKFQSNDKCRLFIGTIRADKESITLTAARSVLFIELGWTPSEHNQAEDRVNRIGQKYNKVNVYYILGRNTVDQYVWDVIEKKREVIDQIIDGKSHRKSLVDISKVIQLIEKGEKN